MCLYHCNIRYKDVVKHSSVGHKFIFVLSALSLCVLIQKYLHVAGLENLASALVSASWFWPRPESFGFGLGLDLDVLASLNITENEHVQNGKPTIFIFITISSSSSSGLCSQVAFLDVVGAHHAVGGGCAVELLELFYRRVGDSRRKQHRAQAVDHVAGVVLGRPRLSVNLHCRPTSTTHM